MTIRRLLILMSAVLLAVWLQAATAQTDRTFRGHSSGITSVAFSPNRLAHRCPYKGEGEGWILSKNEFYKEPVSPTRG